jgi:outer membrane protein OmpA-like peptidoglycan-associated protein
MIKACNEYSRIKDYCYENELIKERIKEKRKITDSLEQEFLKKKKNKLKYFSSIYFYGNTAKIRDISERDMISVIDFVKQYSDSKYEIAGYSNGVSNDNVDVKRANVVKKRLIEAGIDSTILKVVGYGNKNMKVDSDDLREDNFGSYNANMRVEIKLLDK